MIEFQPPSPPQFGGSCKGEPALFALNHFVTARGNVRVNAQVYPDEVIAPFLKRVLDDPKRYDTDAESAQAAVNRFINLCAPLLEREGGQREWLEQEFRP